EDGIRCFHVTGVQTCALPILARLLVQLVRRRVRVVPFIAVITLVFVVAALVFVAPGAVLVGRLLAATVVGAGFGGESVGGTGKRSEERRVGEGRRKWGAVEND